MNRKQTNFHLVVSYPNFQMEFLTAFETFLKKKLIALIKPTKIDVRKSLY